MEIGRGQVETWAGKSPLILFRKISGGHMARGCNESVSVKLCALMLLAFQSVAADLLSGRVVRIADGDTLTVLDQKQEWHKVRLTGIDAPEKSSLRTLMLDSSRAQHYSTSWKKKGV
jgi:endonuclease YncB( thermonuclease family)